MTTSPVTYCLDSNVLIQAWQKYYSPKICPDYWNILCELGKREKIFLAEEIRDEITKTDDELSDWLKSSGIPVHRTDSSVTDCWKHILEANEHHKFLVAESKGRSLGDPWVISHAIVVGAIVVTREEFVQTPRPSRIKIPNVCQNMGVPWVNDFQFIEALNIQFSCTLK